MTTEPQGIGPEGREPQLEQDEDIEARVARETYEGALEFARPYMATGRTLEEALDAMRADGFEPNFDLSAIRSKMDPDPR